MKILVTGATGYAGYHTAIAFRQAGHQVSGLVRDKNKDRAQKLLSYEVNLAQGDLSDPDTYRHDERVPLLPSATRGRSSIYRRQRCNSTHRIRLRASSRNRPKTI